jgi:hypothetical protein
MKPGVLCPVNNTHTSTAKFFKDAIVREGLADEGGEFGGGQALLAVARSEEHGWRGALPWSPYSACLGRSHRRRHTAYNVKDDRPKQIEKNHEKHHLHPLGKRPHAT